MNFARNKTTNVAIAFLMILSIIVSYVPISNAQNTWTTFAYVSASPNPIGVGQKLLVCVWLEPVLPAGEGYVDVTVTIEKPNGTKEVRVLPKTQAEGSDWFEFVPDETGTYYLSMNMPAQDIAGDHYEAAQSRKIEFVAQEEQIPTWQEAPLPTDYWTRPISGDNREWYTIAGDWWTANYDSSRSNFNPYTTGPESAHVLWKIPMYPGGIIGGDYYPLDYYGSPNPAQNPIRTIVAGKAYHTITTPSGSGIHCVDVKTGEELWVKEGSFSFGAVEIGGTAVTPILVRVGSSLVKYNAFTGAVMTDVSGTMSGTADWPYIYSFSGSGENRRLIKWNAMGSTSNFASRIEYNVTANPDVSISAIQGDIGFRINSYPRMSGAYDLTNGNLLWNRTMPEDEGSVGGGYTSGDGRVYIPARHSRIIAYDLRTGNRAWISEELPYPWGTFYAYQNAYAYGNAYFFTYGGVVCIDGATGKIKWTFQTPSSGFETPFNGYAFWCSGIVGDGKVYAATSEHSITNPFPRGNRLWCIDAETGEALWSMWGACTTRQGSIADGVLVTGGELDGNAYGFSKGKTKVTVTAPDLGTTVGKPIVIKGTVTDQSPAQPDTPAISDESMTDWMAYLHQSQPMPTDATGVEVWIDVLDSNGNYRNIGTTTSDMSGFFTFTWEPDIPGDFTVIATFAGSKSYYASYAETSFTAIEPEVTPCPTPTPAPMTDMYILGSTAGIIVAVVVVGLLLLLLLRKK